MDETFDPKQTEEITKIVLQVINDQNRIEKKKVGIWKRLFGAVTKNWAVFLFTIGVITAMVGWLFFSISPFHKFKEIANNQKDYDRKELQIEYKKAMVQRHLKLGNSFLSTSQIEAARIEFNTILQLDEFNIEAHFGKLKTEIFLPIKNDEYNPEIAEMRLSAILEEMPDDPHINFYLGDINRAIDKNAALNYYRKAIEIDSSLAAAYFGIAVIYDKENNIDAAIEMYLKALSLSEWNQSYLSNLAYQYYKKKDFDQAIRLYDLSWKLNGSYVLNLFGLASAYRFQGKLNFAMFYNKTLIDAINNQKIMEQSINNGVWFWNSEFDPIYFYDISMKKCYAYYNAAITAYLSGDIMAADNYIAKAKALNSSGEWRVKKLVAFNNKELGNYNQSFERLLIAFNAKYGL